MGERCPLGPGPCTLLVRIFWLCEASLEEVLLQLALENKANQPWALGEALEEPPGICLCVARDAGVPTHSDATYNSLFSPKLFSHQASGLLPSYLRYCPKG